MTPWYDNGDQHPWVSALDFVIETAGTKNKQTVPDVQSTITSFLHSDYGLEYDTMGGSPSYFRFLMFPTKTEFEFTKFVAKTKTKVNCHDLASAVSTMANLIGSGSRYHFMGPFGYINQTHLIGVPGQTNNPFFNAGGGNCTGGQLTGVDAVNPIRCPFGNHGFVQLTGNVYDATVQPHLGTETLGMYITNSIDTSTAAELLLAGNATHVKGASTLTLK
jgi:hypothetical protein